VIDYQVIVLYCNFAELCIFDGIVFVEASVLSEYLDFLLYAPTILVAL
jgi:hypothetical protein